MNDTPPKSKCDRTPTKATCDRTPTPRTDEAWAAWQYAGSGMSVHVGRELERELTAAREELETYKRANKELRGDVVRFATHIATVTEQRDRLAEALNKIQGAGLTAVDAFDELDRIDEIVDEALQSLNQDHFPDVGNMIGNKTSN